MLPLVRWLTNSCGYPAIDSGCVCVQRGEFRVIADEWRKWMSEEEKPLAISATLMRGKTIRLGGAVLFPLLIAEHRAYLPTS